MSSIYKHLSKADVKVERESPVLIPPQDDLLEPRPQLGLLKFAIFGAFLVSIAAVGASFYFYRQLSAERESNAEMKVTYAQFQQEAEGLRAEVSQYRGEMERSRDQLKTYANERNDLKREADRSRIQISSLEKKIQELESKNRLLQKEANDLRAAQAVPVSRPVVSPPPVPVAVAPVPVTPPVTAVRSAAPLSGPGSTAGEIPLVSLSSVPVAEKSVSAAADTAPPVLKKGVQVMTINRKFNFVVINLGVSDGAKMGQALTVERRGRAIARLEIEKLYDNFSAATIIQESEKDKINEGDGVVLT